MSTTGEENVYKVLTVLMSVHIIMKLVKYLIQHAPGRYCVLQPACQKRVLGHRYVSIDYQNTPWPI